MFHQPRSKDSFLIGCLIINSGWRKERENGSGNEAERFNNRGNNNYKIILKQSVNTPKTTHTLRVSGDAMENKYRNSRKFFGL